MQETYYTMPKAHESIAKKKSRRIKDFQFNYHAEAGSKIESYYIIVPQEGHPMPFLRFEVPTQTACR